MSRLPSATDLLDRPAGEAVRCLALAELERAALARRALAAGEDREALHDFRVALRRLRSQLRAFRGALDDSVPKRLERELKAIAAATGAGRDAEVGLHWLERFGGPASARHKHGWRALSELLTARHEQALHATLEKLAGRFDKLERRLSSRLSAWTVELGIASRPELFRALIASELDRHGVDLAAALGAIVEPSHDDEVHAARIEAKRVRYLLDPLAGALPEAKPALLRLRALQDLLGELNDLRLLAVESSKLAAGCEFAFVERVAREGEAARVRRPRERSGLLALAERIAAERAERWRRLTAEWIGEKAPERAVLDSELAAVERALSL